MTCPKKWHNNHPVLRSKNGCCVLLLHVLFQFHVFFLLQTVAERKRKLHGNLYESAGHNFKQVSKKRAPTIDVGAEL